MSVTFATVSSTARLTAYMRQFSDIPFARHVAQRIRAKEAFDALLQDMQLVPEDLSLYGPIFEIRYKSIAQTIRKCGATQVLELASGFSLRGLAMTQDPRITYVESDLEDLTREKTQLLSEGRRHGLPSHRNFHLAIASALDPHQLQAAVEPFRRDQPIAVVNEGLLLYLSRTEMQTVARNIRDLLSQFGGVWITPDFSLKEDVRNATTQQRLFRRIVAAATDRNLFDNAFENNEQMLSFFRDLGLRSRIVNQVDETPAITSLEALNLSRDALSEAQPGLKLWILELDSLR
jgi:O-methyltransferase involved in polyketide biosynthesis